MFHNLSLNYKLLGGTVFHNLSLKYKLFNTNTNVVQFYSHIQRFAILVSSGIIRASSRENLSSEVCEQQRRRPACASAQSDQRICCSLFGK